VTIAPYVGGRVYATHSDIGEDDWGEVTVWETGYRLVRTFTLAQDAQHPSEVTVELVPDEGQREVPASRIMRALLPIGLEG
jgi:hypothetical protein